ncbi:hypothetical protein GCM10009533_57050 [Saccharopolyspora spinosporotrichia]|uniref:Cytochrome P450 n=1 Tax=Saccharopolyspora erythraea TaxID=1836 RepID=A0ABP3NV98_SACER
MLMAGPVLSSSDIPGPPPSAGGHNLRDIAEAGGLPGFQVRLHRTYGEIAHFAMPNAQVVSVASPEVLESTLDLPECPMELAPFLTPLADAANVLLSGEQDRARWRRTVIPALSCPHRAESDHPRFIDIIEESAQRWSSTGEPVALERELDTLALRLMCTSVLGSTPGQAAIVERVTDAFERLPEFFLGQVYGVRTTSQEPAVDSALTTLRDVVTFLVDEVAPSDLISAARRAGQSSKDLVNTLLAILIGAHRTTGTVVSHALRQLMRHRDVAKRLRAELKTVLGGKAAPAFHELPCLRYLRRTLNESVRLASPVPGIARRAPDGIALGAYRIPAGTVVHYAIRAVHMNPRVWPRPDEFDPDRFDTAPQNSRPAMAFVPFGIGRNDCPGALVAMEHALLMLAVLAHRFRFESRTAGKQGSRFSLGGPCADPVRVRPRRSR